MLPLGQVCSSLTRIIVSRSRHDEFVEALAGTFSQVRVGDPFDPQTQMGPLAMDRQRDRVEGYIAKGIAEGATLATGGGRPKDLERGYYIEPTVFGNVDNHATIAREEIFGPVLSVIPADNEDHAVTLANDTIYGLNASVFTNDVDRARRRRRSVAFGHGGAQRVPHRLRDGVRRIQAVGHRPGRRDRRPAAVPRDQDGDSQRRTLLENSPSRPGLPRVGSRGWAGAARFESRARSS